MKIKIGPKWVTDNKTFIIYVILLSLLFYICLVTFFLIVGFTISFLSGYFDMYKVINTNYLRKEWTSPRDVDTFLGSVDS